ncbi:acyltransferase family protein [Roseateles sp. NT4]|uniref:acyltransferase family protein n=1 Tax=Roseateles sp. NT4 TaxID=3453715 RepID=UPI003EEB70C3
MDPSEHRTNNFNVLRLALASLVILSHGPELHDGDRHRELLTGLFGTLSFGEFAVDCFFLLSGFLILQSWQRQPQVLAYLRKRILRIFPAFAVASLVCALVVGPLAVASASAYWSEFSIPSFLKGLATLYTPITPPVFPDRPHPEINGAMWTIRWEFFCYVTVLAAGVLARTRLRLAWTTMTVIVFSVWLFERLVHGVEPHLPYTYWQHPLWRLLACFLAGGCFHLYRNHLAPTRRGVLLALPALLACMFSPQASEPALIWLGGYLLLAFAETPVPLLSRINQGPDLSYGIYLYGWPVQNLASAYWPQADVWLMLPAVYAVVASLAALSWFLIEKPCLRLKTRRADAVKAVEPPGVGRPTRDAGQRQDPRFGELARAGKSAE